MSSPYQAYPYRGEQTETSMLQRLLDLVNTQQPSSLPPSDTVTRTDYENIPDLTEPTRPTFQNQAQGILNTASAFSPVDPVGFGEGFQMMKEAPSLMA